jgi:hypothetical protein
MIHYLTQAANIRARRSPADSTRRGSVPKELNALTCTTDSAIIGHQMFFLNSIFALGGVQGGKL